MKTLKILTLVYLTSSLIACAYNPSPVEYEQKLLGTWTCQTKTEKNGSLISVNIEETYVRNGRANIVGIIKFKRDKDTPEIEYAYAGTSTWEIDGNYLIETVTDFKFTNISHPEFDDVFNLNDMTPKNISDSQEIIEFAGSKLTLKSESYGYIYSCVKKS